mgnify:CR=1 FL=1
MYAYNRIKLLSDSEIETIYSLPTFNETEKTLYFSLTDQEKAIAEKYRTVKSQVHFMLSLGYFKAKQQFYTIDLSSEDAQFILAQYFNNDKITLSGKIDDKTNRKQKNDILTLLGYQDWSSKFQTKIELHICELLRYYPKTHSALRQLLIYFSNQNLVLKFFGLVFQLRDLLICFPLFADVLIWFEKAELHFEPSILLLDPEKFPSKFE